MATVSADEVSSVEAMLGQVGVRAGLRTVLKRTGGELSGVYEARFVDGRQSLIVKVYAYGLMSDALSGRISQVVGAQDETGPTGEAFTVMTCLPGLPLSEISGQLSPPAVGALYAEMGELIAQVHAIPQAAFGYLVEHILDPVATNAAYIERQFAKKLEEYRGLGGDAELADCIGAALVTAQAERVLDLPGRPSLCHNDFHEGNVLVAQHGDRWQVCGLVDVENAIAADPLLDLAKTYAYSIRRDRSKANGLAEGHPALAPGWQDDRKIRLHRLYHALELWAWFASTGRHDALDGLAEDMKSLS